MSYSINVSFVLSGVETPLDPIKYIIDYQFNITFSNHLSFFK